MKSFARTTLAVVAMALTGALLAIWAAPRWREHRLMQDALPLQTALETYRQLHACYPEALVEIGFPEREEGPLHYQRTSATTYQLWFGTTLGESRLFDSTDRRWH